MTVKESEITNRHRNRANQNDRTQMEQMYYLCMSLVLAGRVQIVGSLIPHGFMESVLISTDMGSPAFDVIERCDRQ